MVYKVDCFDCHFFFTHKQIGPLQPDYDNRAVRVGDSNSKVAKHANEFGHFISTLKHATGPTVVARDYRDRLFLEA